MKLTWRQLPEPEVADVWDRVAQHGTGATFFHTRAWSATIARCFPRWSAKPLTIAFSDGNMMIMPIMWRRHLMAPFGYSESMIPGVYGGPIFLSPPSTEHWEATWSAIRHLPDINIVGNPYLPYEGTPARICRPMFTQAIALAPGYTALRKAFRKGHRSDIKAAQKLGMSVRLASSRCEIDQYYQVYVSSLQRWDKSASGFYPPRLFYDLFEQAQAGAPIQFWLAHTNERVIGGALIVCHQDHATYWHGAYHSDYFSHHPAHLTVSTALEEYCGSGMRWFDFNPSGGLAGVERFKAGFGAEKLPFSYYRSTTPFGKAYRLYRHTVERSLRRCSL